MYSCQGQQLGREPVQADFEGKTYILIDTLSLGIYLFSKQDVDA